MVYTPVGNNLIYYKSYIILISLHINYEKPLRILTLWDIYLSDKNFLWVQILILINQNRARALLFISSKHLENADNFNGILFSVFELFLN